MLIEGKESFFLVNGKVSMGTVYKCECCGTWASVNTVTLDRTTNGVKYGKALSIAQANGEVNRELFYNEQLGDVCDKCDK